MRGILLIIKNEFIRSFKYKKKLVISMLIPILAIISAIGVNDLMKPSISLGIDANGHGKIYDKLKLEAKAIDGLSIKKAAPKSLTTDLMLGKYSGVISLKDNKTFTVICYDNILKKNISNATKEYFLRGELKFFYVMLSSMKKGGKTKAERSVSFILMALLVSCTLGACNIIKDQSEGILKRFYISIYKPYIYVLGTFFYSFIINLLQIFIAFIIVNILRMDFGMGNIKFLLVGMIMSMVAASVACLIVGISKSELQASSIGAAVAVISSLLGGAFLPLEKMPAMLKQLSNLTFTKWFDDLIKNIEGGTLTDNKMLPIIIIIMLSILMIVIGSELNKKKFLMDKKG